MTQDIGFLPTRVGGWAREGKGGEEGKGGRGRNYPADKGNYIIQRVTGSSNVITQEIKLWWCVHDGVLVSLIHILKLFHFSTLAITV